MTANGHRECLGNDGNVLKSDCYDGCATVNLVRNHSFVHLKFVHFVLFNYTSVELFFKKIFNFFSNQKMQIKLN